MRRENYPYLSTALRLAIYAIAIVLVSIQWIMHLSVGSWVGLSACLLFFLATLTLCQSNYRMWLLSGLLTFIIVMSLILDSVAFSMTGEVQTAITAMKMMTAVTIMQNIVLSLYLFGSIGLLWRELNRVTQRLLPASWFTLRFVFSAMS